MKYQKQKKGGFDKVVKLSGTHQEMGYMYGKIMQEELKGALSVLEDYFINEHHITYKQLVDKANEFYDRYSYSYKLLLEGISESSGLSLDEVNILNGMETLNALLSGKENWFLNTDIGACAFVFLPPEKTYSGFSLMGRNYDFPEPYKTIATNLTVTILEEPNTISTAIIGLPGQIYCPSCVNSQGYFVELNNGMPSGGFVNDIGRQSLLINMLQIAQNSGNFEEMNNQFMAMEADYFLIINTANKHVVQSYEYSTVMGMKPYFPNEGEVFASTNFFLNSTWGSKIPQPTDNTTWVGVTRRDNLLKIANSKEKFDVEDFKVLMEMPIEQGGSFWNLTIYQIIYDSFNNTLYLRSTPDDTQSWTELNLNEYFSEDVLVS